MKKIIYLLAIMPALFFASCNKYLDILPKGKKIPQTYADFEALLRDEATVHQVPIPQAIILPNDRFVSPANLNYYKLWDINYNWKEQEDRKIYNNSDESTYYYAYSSISVCNLILEHGPTMTEATAQQRDELMATASVLRAISYYTLANYYAADYDSQTAGQLLSVPLIESADIGAPSKQVTIAEIYDYMINDIKSALPKLPNQGQTILHPGKGAAYALLSRIYLQMDNYQDALENSEKALEYNDKLYDWTAYYNANKSQIEEPANYALKKTPMDFAYVENYYFRHGQSPNFTASELSLQVERAAGFEKGDSKFASRWKLRTVVPNTYYTSTMTGFYNTQGLTTVEVYLIAAECQARRGNIQKAMDFVNKVRKTRILAANYTDLTAQNATDAIKKIQQLKQNELIHSIIPFADYKRLNKESAFATTLRKTIDGKVVQLSPTSHLWIMPFPLGATENSGNGSIKQNVEK